MKNETESVTGNVRKGYSDEVTFKDLQEGLKLQR